MAKAKAKPGLSPQVRKRLAGERDLPTQGEFVEELFRLAGGPKALAKMVWTEFSSKSASPMLRSRVLELLLKQLASMEAQIDPEKHLASLTEEEIEEFVRVRLEKLVGAEPARPE